MRAPGPWRYDADTLHVVASNDDTVADVWSPDDGELIAAAFEYHTAVEALLLAWTTGGYALGDAVHRLREIQKRVDK